MTDDQILERVLRFEGGFVNHPLDRGGATNFGITAAVLGRHRGLGRDATVAEIQALTRAEAIAIYKANYIAKPKFDQIKDDNLRLIVVDSGVLHGTGRAAQWLQAAVGATIDGAVGQDTITKLDAKGPNFDVVCRSVLTSRFKLIGEILRKNPKQVVFAAGWLNRASDLLEFA